MDNQLVPQLLQALRVTPDLLEDMIRRVPASRLKAHRVKGQWCIHSHACHIVGVQPMLLGRLQRFLKEGHPTFTPYFPDKQGEDPEAGLLRLDMQACLREFHEHRRELIAFAESLSEPEGFWDRKAHHPEYDEYTPHILLRHMLMHEHLHMYRIETLWLTSDEYIGPGK